MGDYRTYDYVVDLRIVTSSERHDGRLLSNDIAFLGRIATRIINEVKGVNRVVYERDQRAARDDRVE